MGLHCLLREHQGRGDLQVGLTPRHQPDDIGRLRGGELHRLGAVRSLAHDLEIRLSVEGAPLCQ